MAKEITIRRLLPKVFEGMEDSPRIRGSQIWEVSSFSFHKGCRICLQAESGGGKSSLLSFIYGNREDYKGEILIDGEDIRNFSISRWCDIRCREIALLPQEMRLFPELTALRNVELKNRLTSFMPSERINYLFERLGISDKMDTPVSKLSIGQQQRVAIIRTLCQPFDFIFLDEPVSHLDEANNRIVAQIIEEEAAKLNAGIISTSVGNHLLLSDAEFINL